MKKRQHESHGAQRKGGPAQPLDALQGIGDDLLRLMCGPAALQTQARNILASSVLIN
jgi:hypothetical protein